MTVNRYASGVAKTSSGSGSNSSNFEESEFSNSIRPNVLGAGLLNTMPFRTYPLNDPLREILFDLLTSLFSPFRRSTICKGFPLDLIKSLALAISVPGLRVGALSPVLGKSFAVSSKADKYAFASPRRFSKSSISTCFFSMRLSISLSRFMEENIAYGKEWSSGNI